MALDSELGYLCPWHQPQACSQRLLGACMGEWVTTWVVISGGWSSAGRSPGWQGFGALWRGLLVRLASKVKVLQKQRPARKQPSTVQARREKRVMSRLWLAAVASVCACVDSVGISADLCHHRHNQSGRVHHRPLCGCVTHGRACFATTLQCVPYKQAMRQPSIEQVHRRRLPNTLRWREHVLAPNFFQTHAPSHGLHCSALRSCDWPPAHVRFVAVALTAHPASRRPACQWNHTLRMGCPGSSRHSTWLLRGWSACPGGIQHTVQPPIGAWTRATVDGAAVVFLGPCCGHVCFVSWGGARSKTRVTWCLVLPA